MGLTAQVAQWLRSAVRGAEVPEVRIEPTAGAPRTCESYGPAGVDSAPLAGDTAIAIPAEGVGRLVVVGYLDTRQAGTAQPGEYRAYARNSGGEVQAEIVLHADGAIEIASIAGASVTINGVTIDASGNISAPGTVTALAGTPAQVGLSTHIHPTPAGPSSPPTPGT